MKCICKCGKEFDARPAHVRKGFGKFCSRQCSFKWRSKGPEKRKKYNITTPNKGWFGNREPWNKGIKTGIVPANFKGEEVGYDALHDWVNRHKGKAKSCSECGKSEGRMEWANKSREYKRDLNDWISLCVSCHRKFDKGMSAIKKEFNLKGRE